jgi:hypothetical protein
MHEETHATNGSKQPLYDHKVGGHHQKYESDCGVVLYAADPFYRDHLGKLTNYHATPH